MPKLLLEMKIIPKVLHDKSFSILGDFYFHTELVLLMKRRSFFVLRTNNLDQNSTMLTHKKIKTQTNVSKEKISVADECHGCITSSHSVIENIFASPDSLSITLKERVT